MIIVLVKSIIYSVYYIIMYPVASNLNNNRDCRWSCRYLKAAVPFKLLHIFICQEINLITVVMNKVGISKIKIINEKNNNKLELTFKVLS